MPPTLADPPIATVTVDPRFEARRAAVAAERRRRRHLRLAAVASLLAVAMTGYGVTRSAFTDVDSITVTGWDRGEREQVISASGIELGAQLTDIDTAFAADRIEALVPWVAVARVSRNWPSSIRITVVERRAVAQVRSDGSDWLLVDAGGQLLQSQPYREPGLLVIEGVAPGAVPGVALTDAAARGLAVVGQMSPELLTHVAGLRFRGADLELVLVDGATVAFGLPDQVQMKLLSLETVLARVDQSCVVAIDVSVPRRPLVRRDFACDGGSVR